MPDVRDLEKIAKMLTDIGEKELEIGELPERRGTKPQEVPTEQEAPAVPEPPLEEALEGEKKEEEGELLDLLKDIEIGLSEEKELEKKLLKREAEEAAEPFEVEEPSPVGPEEEGEPVSPVEIEMVMEPEREETEAIPAVEHREEEPRAMPEEEELEEGFDLPDDFDMSKIGVEEGPPLDLIKGAEERKEAPAPEPPTEAEEKPLEEIPSGPEVQVGEEEEEAFEPSIEEFEMPELEEIESLEEVAELPTVEEKEGLEAIEEPTVEVEEKPEEEHIAEIEIPSDIEIEEIVTPVSEVEMEAPAEIGEEPGKILPEVEEAPVEIKEAGEVRREPEAEVAIELSDEDIILIKTKLKQISPQVASLIKDSIVNVTLPSKQMSRLLRLLIQDAPEDEIVGFLERITGRRIVPVIKPVEAVPPLRPARFALIAENLGALIRIVGLFVSILAVLGMIFFVFLYKPIKSTRYYREGIEFIRDENYSEAEKSFTKATSIYEKIKEYDNYGWEYLIAGNYDAAELKFKRGIEIDKGNKNLDLREHLAKLYNILHRYEDADELYTFLVSSKPDYYHYIKLKGSNLIDWGRREETRLDEAYNLFQETFEANKKNGDPLFPMLYVDILKNNRDRIDYLFGILKEKYPGDIDKEIYADLASYYISVKYMDPVWDIMSAVIGRFPDYPKAYYVLSLYNKEINNKKDEEGLLHLAIEYERERELKYPWETRDRDLLSNAYNNLGEIYARMEIPGKTAEAISYFKESININDENKKAYFNLAQTYFYQEKNYDLALRYYERAKFLGFENNDLNYNLGLLYFYRRSFEKALKQWSELSEIMPENPNVNFAIGSAFLYMGKYNSALGEFLMLSETYGDFVKSLGEIKPWSAYHRRIVLGASSVYKNLGVAYQKLYETTGDSDYQKNSLVSLYKAGELADIVGTDRGIIQYNINYIIHPDVIRSDMAINDNISDDFRFVVR